MLRILVRNNEYYHRTQNHNQMLNAGNHLKNKRCHYKGCIIQWYYYLPDTHQSYQSHQ